MLNADHHRSTCLIDGADSAPNTFVTLSTFNLSPLSCQFGLPVRLPIHLSSLRLPVFHLPPTFNQYPSISANCHPTVQLSCIPRPADTRVYPRQLLTIWLLPLTRTPGLCLAYLSITLLVWQTRASAQLSQSESWLTQNDSGNFAKTSAGTNRLLMNFNIWGTL